MSMRIQSQAQAAYVATQQALAPKMFSLTPAQPTAVYLDTRTGAILNIRQE